MATDDGSRIRERIAYIITGVWVVSFLADVFLPAYEPSPYVHVAMMSVAGWLFAAPLVRRNGNGE